MSHLDFRILWMTQKGGESSMESWDRMSVPDYNKGGEKSRRLGHLWRGGPNSGLNWGPVLSKNDPFSPEKWCCKIFAILNFLNFILFFSALKKWMKLSDCIGVSISDVFVFITFQVDVRFPTTVHFTLSYSASGPYSTSPQSFFGSLPLSLSGLIIPPWVLGANANVGSFVLRSARSGGILQCRFLPMVNHKVSLWSSYISSAWHLWLLYFSVAYIWHACNWNSSRRAGKHVVLLRDASFLSPCEPI